MDDFLIWWRRFLTAAMFVALQAPIAPAVEIRLRERVQLEAGIVRLSDIADVVGAQSSTGNVAEIELFPVPAVGGKRYLRVRELQDMLAERKIDLLENRLTGASVVEIVNVPSPVVVSVTTVKPVVRPNLTRTKNEVRTALVSYLRQQAKKGEVFDVVVAVNDNAAVALQQADYRFEVRGGEQPWTGRQQFELWAEGTAAPIAIEAEVSTSPMVVVALRSLNRGAIIQAGDVELQPLPANRIVDQASVQVEEVIGRETTQALAAGQILTAKTFRSQRLVQRGNPVTVVARSSGLRVRTTARAREDGSLGEVITVESLLNRQSFFARVVGIDEVEVYARAVEARQVADTDTMTRHEESR